MALFTKQVVSLPSNLLKDKYIVPPFSILNTITQNWQTRKKQWESLGINSTAGRDTKLHNATPKNTFSARGSGVKIPESISTFDPLLCEILIKWFSKPDAIILDPFAGGSVRGIVSCALGRQYYGIDLSETQVTQNLAQFEEVSSHYKFNSRKPEYTIGDSSTVLADPNCKIPMADMILTCPPYYNLEKYSNDSADLSNMSSYDDFLIAYDEILRLAIGKLHTDAFMVIVVSEIRSKSGEYYGFVPDTINIIRKHGLKYYNEIILENNIGSLPIRAPKYFDQSRKIGRHHQNILVFYKGDTKNIESIYGKFSDS